ncbi:DUF1566 domain-containing protein, partial [bacterium]|nr:DUF1566 domain-containing protein [bacterium]
QAVTVVLRNITGEGVVAWEKSYTLPAHGSITCQLAASFATGSALAGKITISATGGISAFALYSNSKSGGSYYAGINAAVAGTRTVSLQRSLLTPISEAVSIRTKTAAETLTRGSSLALPLPDTGQIKCYNSGESIVCPVSGKAFYGQDAHYTRERSYTKLDGNGSDLSDSTASWSMVRDNVTGLIWEVKTSDGSIHGQYNIYSWRGAETEFIKALNDANYGGHADWRLPTVVELSGLIDADGHFPAITEIFFPETKSSNYWSSTPCASPSGYAWRVSFFNGAIDYEDKFSSYYVRAVRSGQSRTLDPLVIFSDGAVSDPNTGLIWQQAEAGEMTWEEALSYCENLELAGYGDWRLPDRHELQSLVDYNHYRPSLEKIFFPEALSSHYWSSTSNADYTYCAWRVNFLDGGISGRISKTTSYYVRAVRSGQSRSLDPLISSFSATSLSGTAPLTVTFLCSASDPDGGDIIQYQWDFDGSGISEQTGTGFITHIFSAAGTYVVTCTVVDDEGSTHTSDPLVIVVSGLDDPDDIDNDGDGYSENQGDCNDAEATIHPGATEICGDGIDQDCNGSDLICPVTYTPGPYHYYLPGFASGNGSWTGLGLSNGNSSQSTDLKVVVYGDDGGNLASVVKTLPAGGQSAFAVGAGITGSGWIYVNSHLPLTGLAFLGGSGTPALIADVPFISELEDYLVIPHIAQDNTWATT